MGYPWEKDKEADKPTDSELVKTEPITGSAARQVQEEAATPAPNPGITVLGFLEKANMELEKAIGKANALRHLLGE